MSICSCDDLESASQDSTKTRALNIGYHSASREGKDGRPKGKHLEGTVPCLAVPCEVVATPQHPAPAWAGKASVWNI